VNIELIKQGLIGLELVLVC